jgi:hypothetical protein
MIRIKKNRVLSKLFLFSTLFFSLTMLVACDFIFGAIELGQQRKYTVTFDLLPDSMACNNCQPREGKKGDTIFLPTPIWTGLEARDFYGWFICFGEDFELASVFYETDLDVICPDYHKFDDPHIIIEDVNMVPQFNRIILSD